MKEKRYILSYPDLIAEWDWKKNDELNIYPGSISIGSEKKVYWKCSQGHSWIAGPSVIIGFHEIRTTEMVFG